MLHSAIVAAFLVCLFAVPAAAGSIYNGGDLVRLHPIESTSIFLAVVVISALLELAIGKSRAIKRKYFQVMFQTVNQEVMLVGILVLALTFAESVYDWPNRWVLMLKWSMMCLFLMIMSFIALIFCILFVVWRSDNSWSAFETERMESENAKISKREALYKASFFRFQNALSAYGYSARMGVRYSTYLSKLMRKNVVALTDLTWVSWVCLATVVVLNALRTEGFRRLSQRNDENLDDDLSVNQRLVLYLSFTAIVGYGMLAAFLTMYIILDRRLKAFLNTSDGGSVGGALGSPLIEARTASDLDDSRAYLFRRSLEVTLEMLQIVLLGLLWYLSTFLLSFSYPISAHLTVYAPAIFIFGCLPVVAAVVLLPWMLTVITILGSLGNNLDENTVQTLIRKAGIPVEELPPKMREMVEENARRKLMRQCRKGLEVRPTLRSARGQPPRPVNAHVPKSLEELQRKAVHSVNGMATYAMPGEGADEDLL